MPTRGRAPKATAKPQPQSLSGTVHGVSAAGRTPDTAVYELKVRVEVPRKRQAQGESTYDAMPPEMAGLKGAQVKLEKTG